METSGESGFKGTFGLLLVAGGIILIYLVLNDLQAFGSNPSGTPGQTNILGSLLGLPYAAGQAPAPVSGPSTTNPGTGGSCPNGYVNINGVCNKVIPVPL